jgi:hypothetical protein
MVQTVTRPICAITVPSTNTLLPPPPPHFNKDSTSNHKHCAGHAASSVGFCTPGHMSLYARPEAGNTVYTTPEILLLGVTSTIHNTGEHRQVLRSLPTSAHVHKDSDHTGFLRKLPAVLTVVGARSIHWQWQCTQYQAITRLQTARATGPLSNT